MLRWPQNVQRTAAALIVLAFIGLGVLYAVLTPPWQVPDEPAHYNYVRHLVEERRLPVLQMGDYDQAYMQEITTARFHPSYEIDAIRYEFHQPPLYYLLVMPLYAIFKGTLLPLRLFTVLIGAGTVIVAYLVGRAVLPQQSWLAPGMTAFVAFIPQRVAMTAAVENDALAELLLGLILLGLVRWLQADTPWSTRHLIGIGILIGLGLLTKTSAYIAVPLAVIAAWLKFWTFAPAGERRHHLRPALIAVAALLLPALLIGLPWLIRNAAVYGNWDILGLKRHEQVVAGQPRTADLIAQQGGWNLLLSWLSTAFHSFWAQFGWMAVPIDARIYTALGLLSGVVALGFCLWLIGSPGQKRQVRPAGVLLACSGLMTLATFGWYNLTFYQAQGRYLFPALIPLGVAWALGLDEILRRENAIQTGLVLALATVIGGIRWAIGACGDKWRVLIAGLGAAFWGGRWFLPERSRPWLFAAAHVPLLVLCAVSPFWFIVPYLKP